jgi:hypothetical protein
MPPEAHVNTYDGVDGVAKHEARHRALVKAPRTDGVRRDRTRAATGGDLQVASDPRESGYRRGTAPSGSLIRSMPGRSKFPGRVSRASRSGQATISAMQPVEAAT